MFEGIRQLGRDTVAYGLSSVASSILAIFLVPLYTRVLSPADYGLVALVTAIMGVVGTVVVLGLDSAAGRWYFDDEDPQRRRAVMSSWFWCQLAVSSVVAGALLATLPWLAPRLSSSPAAWVALMFATLAVPLATFRQVAGIWLRCRRLAWKASTFFTVSALAAALGSALLVLVVGLRVPGVFLGQLLGAGVTAAFALVIVGRQIRPRYFSRTMLSGMIRFGIPLIPAAVAGWVTASSDRIILNVMLGEAAVGIYSVAASVSAVVALFTNGFQFAWGPFAYSTVHRPNGRELLGAALSWFTWAACFLAATISVFAPEALQILTTAKFAGAATSVPYLAFSWVALGVMSVVAIGANVAKKSAVVAVSVFVGAGVNVALNVALIPVMGRDGAGAATLIAYLCAAAVMYRGSQREFSIPYRMDRLVVMALWSAAVVLLSRSLLAGDGVESLLARGLMCLSFLPLAFVCRLVTPAAALSIVRKGLSRRRVRV